MNKPRLEWVDGGIQFRDGEPGPDDLVRRDEVETFVRYATDEAACSMREEMRSHRALDEIKYASESALTPLWAVALIAIFLSLFACVGVVAVMVHTL